MQQNSKNAYNYYVKLLLGLIGVYPANKYRVTDDFVRTGLKHYGCELI